MFKNIDVEHGLILVSDKPGISFRESRIPIIYSSDILLILAIAHTRQTSRSSASFAQMPDEKLSPVSTNKERKKINVFQTCA